MSDVQTARRYRFGTFEADAAAGELRRQGMRVKLNAQPFQILVLMLERPGDVLTREEICRQVWPEGTFVDYEHGVNSAVNRIREAIGDSAANPRFIETLARRGYRFIAPVEQIVPGGAAPVEGEPVSVEDESTEPVERAGFPSHILTTAGDLPKTSGRTVKTLLIVFQLMYLGFYIGALANLAEIDDLLSPLPEAAKIYTTLIVSAAILIPMRAFILCAVLFRAPGFREKFLRLWALLLVADILWAMSPFLLLHHINFGLALACTALLVYSPFVQRSLVLMGADAAPQP